jgi:hypothetical protein
MGLILAVGGRILGSVLLLIDTWSGWSVTCNGIAGILLITSLRATATLVAAELLDA